MTHIREIETDYSTQEAPEIFSNEFDNFDKNDLTYGAETEDDFLPIIKGLLEINPWKTLDKLKEITYGYVKEEDPAESELEEEESDYSSDTDLTNPVYEGTHLEELELPSLTIIKYEPEKIDILSELQKRIEEENEIDYEEPEEQPKILQLQEEKESLEDEIQKAA